MTHESGLEEQIRDLSEKRIMPFVAKSVCVFEIAFNRLFHRRICAEYTKGGPYQWLKYFIF